MGSSLKNWRRNEGFESERPNVCAIHFLEILEERLRFHEITREGLVIVPYTVNELEFDQFQTYFIFYF
jgi:hypothetical protein